MNRIQSLTGTYFIAVAAAITLVAALAACGSGEQAEQALSVTGAAGDCVRPRLSPSRESVFWASYTDYRARTLTVAMRVTNTGDNDASALTVTRLVATGGVTAATPLPHPFAATLPTSSDAGFEVTFIVPEGLSSFRLDTYMSAGGSCGNSYDYPPPGEEAPTGETIFPPDNYWNTPVDTLPVDANSAAYIQTIGAVDSLHPDFGSGTWDGGPIGIPYVEIPAGQPRMDVVFDYADESDPGPYPIPPDAPIEGGPDSDGDRHIILLDREGRTLYELFYAWPQPDGSWTAGSGAIYDLDSNELRPDGWTSADAAGLPIFPGLVRYDEVEAGEIGHALRFTAPETRRAYVWPARHYASDLTGVQYPPMGQRFRLRADYDISGFSPENQVILTALKKYGMVLADNGAAMFLGGAPDERWNNDDLHELRQLTGADFEAVDISSLIVDQDSGQARL